MDTKKEKDPLPVSLSSVILDTLSCILVDSSPSIRAFEDVNGVKAVVKILKRQGTSREVKIKCMEFLYFYVNAENPTWTRPSDFDLEQSNDNDTTLVPTAPSTPRRPTHRPTSSLSHLSDSSTSSVASAKTPARRVSKSPASSSPSSPEETPFKPRMLEKIHEDGITSTPRKTSASLSIKYPKTPRKALQPLNMERRKLSPANEALSLETPPNQRQDRLVLGRSATPNAFTRGHRRAQSSCDVVMSSPASPPPLSPSANIATKEGSTCGSVTTRTIEEKKQILRGMMSNVDSLLEGMNKVGIWGLA
ncbi:hypothetical protein EIP86_000328 [Pleurotus ostreatoroseus]|nr:hypothetical protein EIP86_000328 [Pleurotus ostreatoroseus]